MAKRGKSKNKSTWAKLGPGYQPVNGVAASVVGKDRRKPKHEELFALAKRTKDLGVRKQLLAEARAAKIKYESRMISSPAVEKARKALAHAQWLRQENRW